MPGRRPGRRTAAAHTSRPQTSAQDHDAMTSRAPTGHPVLTEGPQPGAARSPDAARALVAPGGRRRPAPGRPAGPGALVAVPRPLVAARPVRPPRNSGDADRPPGGAHRDHAKHGPPGHRRGLPLPPPAARRIPRTGAADLDVADRPGRPRPRRGRGRGSGTGRGAAADVQGSWGSGWRSAGPSATRRRSPRRYGRWRRWSSCRPGRCGAGQARWSSPPPSTGWTPLDESAALDEMVLRYLAAFGPRR